jgi:hypothetical protein
MFFPPIGTALGVAILGLTAASAGIKTSLYVGEARDANGKLLVKGGDLIHSYVDVALSAGAVGATAAVTRAGKLARAEETTFGKEIADQFAKKTFDAAWHAPKTVITEAIDDAGRKGAAKAILKDGVKDFVSENKVVRRLSRGGLVVGGSAPIANAGDQWKEWNAFGWRSLQHIPHETVETFHEAAAVVHREPELPDLQLKVKPTFSGPRAPTMSPYKQATAPVMGED